jgi:starvation-inducible DNA-binding protein
MTAKAILRDSDLPIGAEERQIVGAQLQGMLVDLVDLSLLGKQAHWSLEGRNGSGLCQRIDELVDSWRALSDKVAERAMAIGVIPDGQAEAVAEATEIEPLSTTALSESEVEDAIAGRVAEAAARGRQRSHRAAVRDSVTADLLAEVVATLDEHAWMIRMRRARA